MTKSQVFCRVIIFKELKKPTEIYSFVYNYLIRQRIEIFQNLKEENEKEQNIEIINQKEVFDFNPDNIDIWK